MGREPGSAARWAAEARSRARGPIRLLALLCWYEESPAWLAELVASMARAGVDHVVAIDGAYAFYPEGRGSSDSDQADVIARTAAGAGMGSTIHVPREPWTGNEVEKRSFLFALAHLIAEPGRDWLWVCDGDEVIERAPRLRERLAETACDVGEVLLTSNDGSRTPIRRLFRVQPSGIHVAGRHFDYRTGDGRRLWALEGAELAETLWDVRVFHRPHLRPAYREQGRALYYERRDRLGIEREPG